MHKITFLGDIVCDKPLLRAAEDDQGFHFDEMFEALKPLFRDSDYVVGALETTFSGEEQGYNSRPFAYNSPDALAKSIRDCGINVLTLANNHCLDYDAEGLARTARLLQELGVLNTGAKESGNPYLLLSCGSVKVAVLSYTAVMNWKPGAKPITAEEKEAVNLLSEVNPPRTASNALKRLLPDQAREYLKKVYLKNKVKNNIPTIKAVVDNEALTERDEPYIQKFLEAAAAAKQEADLVIACVHCGGQFNGTPGLRSQQLFERIAPHVDGIIGNHPHVVQAVTAEPDAIKAYSLGTMNLSLSADYVSFDHLPQYSLALHLYLDEESRKIGKITYTLLHTEEDAAGYLRVKPLGDWLDAEKEADETIQKEILQMHAAVLGENAAAVTIAENEFVIRN